MMNEPRNLIRFYVVGGFLGAGKTSMLTAIARVWEQQGKRMAVITNDQTPGLVDSEVVRTQGIAYREISGACICSRFKDFLYAADTLFEENRPDAIFAEPVGTCGDLSTTVLRPLRAYTPDRYRIMPLTVLVDPLRYEEIFLRSNPWPEDLRYLYEKQIEEADVILLTKADLVSSEIMFKVKQSIGERFTFHRSRLPVFEISAWAGTGLLSWIEALETFQEEQPDGAILFDRQLHNRAEAAMGWLSLLANLQPKGKMDLDLIALSQGFFQRLLEHSGQILMGHCKLFAESPQQTLKASLLGGRSGFSIDPMELSGQGRRAEENRIILNIRALADPMTLYEIAEISLREAASLQQACVQITHHQTQVPVSPKPMIPIENL